MKPRRVFTIALPLAVTLACGCSSPDGGDMPQAGAGPHEQTSGNVAGTGGKIFVEWTLGGAAPSAASCTGVDHIELALLYAQGYVTIAPIPCTLTRFRYDALPEGDADLRLDAVDTQGCLLQRGDAPVTLTETVPATPSPTVAMQSTGAGCR